MLKRSIVWAGFALGLAGCGGPPPEIKGEPLSEEQLLEELSGEGAKSANFLATFSDDKRNMLGTYAGSARLSVKDLYVKDSRGRRYIYPNKIYWGYEVRLENNDEIDLWVRTTNPGRPHRDDPVALLVDTSQLNTPRRGIVQMNDDFCKRQPDVAKCYAEIDPWKSLDANIHVNGLAAGTYWVLVRERCLRGEECDSPNEADFYVTWTVTPHKVCEDVCWQDCREECGNEWRQQCGYECHQECGNECHQECENDCHEECDYDCYDDCEYNCTPGSCYTDCDEDGCWQECEPDDCGYDCTQRCDYDCYDVCDYNCWDECDYVCRDRCDYVCRDVYDWVCRDVCSTRCERQCH